MASPYPLPSEGHDRPAGPEASSASMAWRDRGWVFVGKGATGVLPVVLLALASRTQGLTAMGGMAAAVGAMTGLSELADMVSQRHVPRAEAAGTPEISVPAFNGLRWSALAIALLPLCAVVWLVADPATRWPCAVAVLAAVPTLGSLGSYAVATSRGPVWLLGVGPVAGAVLAVAVAVALRQLQPGLGLWSLTLGLFAGKTAEWWLAARIARMSSPDFRGRALRAEWRSVRFLAWQGLLSAANARLVILLATAVAGAQASGRLAAGVSLLLVVSLSAVAVTVPAYRRAIQGGAPNSPVEAFARARSDWWTAVVLGLVLTLLLFLAAPWLLAAIFALRDAESLWTARLVLVTGLFEMLVVFAGSFYHAAFRDRQLFVIGCANAAAGWLGVAIGGFAAGSIGMAWGFMLSRLAAAVLLYAPLVSSRLSIAGTRDAR